MSERRTHGFPGLYYRVGDFALRHRWGVFAGSLVILVLGGVFFSRLKPQFFPKDLSYLSYVDVWLPPDAPLGATNAAAQRAETVIRRRGRTVWKRTSSERRSEIADHLRRRRRSHDSGSRSTPSDNSSIMRRSSSRLPTSTSPTSSLARCRRR